MTTPLYERLAHQVDIRVSGFSDTIQAGEVCQLAFDATTSDRWFDIFNYVISNRRGYLPVYRMSDGEFIFICGTRPPHFGLILKEPRRVIKAWVKAITRYNTRTFRSGSAGYGYESYTPRQWSDARREYARRVNQLSKKGILAVNFVPVHPGGFALEYFKPMCRWFDKSAIWLDEKNYFPFYFVYALLLGPRAKDFYKDKNILVVTSDHESGKSKAIVASLLKLGARSAKFIPISRDKAMFDRIDISGIGPVDLVLIGAGVGAINILEQVEPLGALSIDAGYVLDCLWKPNEFMGRRVFTMPNGGVSAFGL